MGTRGMIGWVIDGEAKIAYNHFDSYPSGVGVDVLAWCAANQPGDDLRAKVRALRVVTHDTPVTDEDFLALSRFADLEVSTKDPAEWYVLLRKTQGKPALMLDAGVIEDASHFPFDSLFCEWGYVVDLDAETLEVYMGFQQARHTDGRFAQGDDAAREDRGYYPVRLVQTWLLADLPDEKAFVAALEGAEDDES